MGDIDDFIAKNNGPGQPHESAELVIINLVFWKEPAGVVPNWASS